MDSTHDVMDSTHDVMDSTHDVMDSTHDVMDYIRVMVLLGYNHPVIILTTVRNQFRTTILRRYHPNSELTHSELTQIRPIILSWVYNVTRESGP
jgi:hypothetical protein